jgi:predicted ATPase/tRNA A-37 threonylcarbamoyl transferase component Bud32
MNENVALFFTNPRYRLRDVLGEGAMGVVYRATDRLTGQAVALKQVSLPPNLSSAEIEQELLSLAHEFRLLASLRHPHIVSVLDYGFDAERQPFLTMELLADALPILDASQQLPLDAQGALLLQALEALAYLHRRGILHHDLKPANVLVAAGQVRLLDFGLAVLTGERRADDAFGTLQYLAPEVIDGQPYTEAADLYSLGVIAYELLAGQHPYPAQTMRGFLAQIPDQAPDLAHLAGPPALVALVGQLLAKTPAARPTSAAAAIRALQQALGRAEASAAAVRESYLQAASFVGRQVELAQLTHALTQARQGQGSAWLLGGESGVGKSRLLDELRTHALVAGFQVLRGQGVRDGGGRLYQLWREPLRHLLVTTPAVDDLTVSVLLPLVPDAPRLVDRPVPSAPALDAQAAQVRLFTTLTRLVWQAATHASLLLVLEDLHWAQESLLPLPYLTRLVQQHPVVLIGSSRSDERPDLPEHLPEHLPGMTPLPLGRLSAAALADFSAAMLGAAGRQPDVVALMQRETEGNAFFAVEVVRALAEDAGRLDAIGQTALPDTLFPQGVQTILARRLSRILAAAQPLLELAAVVGRELDLAVLEALAGDVALADWWLPVCSNAAVLDVQNGRWQCAHDKLRTGLLAQLDAGRRAASHRQVAQAIATVYSDEADQAARLLYHWGQAGDPAQERRYALQAGRHAAAQFANQEALGYFSRAYDLTPATDVAQRYAVLWEREQIYDRTGERDRQQQDLAALVQLAAALGDPRRQAEAVLRQAQYTTVIGELDRALTLAEQALAWAEAAADERLVTHPYLRRAWVLRDQGKFAEAEPYAQQSLTISQRLGDQRLESEALNLLGPLAHFQGNGAAAQQYLEHSLALCRTTGNRQQETVIIYNLGLQAYSQGAYADALRLVEQALALYQQLGNQAAEGNTSNALGLIEAALGRYADAQARLEQALALTRKVNDRVGESYTLNNLGVALHHQGKYADAQAAFEQSLHLKQAIGDRWAEGYTWNKLGHLHADQGDLAAAQAAYQQATRLFADLPFTPTQIESTAGLARVAVALGNWSEAQAFADAGWRQISAQGLSGGDWDALGVGLALYQTLHALHDARADAILQQAYAELQARATKISDPAYATRLCSR